MPQVLDDPVYSRAKQQAERRGFPDVASFLADLVERDETQWNERADVEAAVTESLADLEAGRVKPAREVFDRLAAKIDRHFERLAKR